MQSINGKDTGGKPFLYLSLALSTNSVSCFFIPGWQAQFCSNHFDSRTRVPSFKQIYSLSKYGKYFCKRIPSFFGLLLKPISPVPGRCNQSVPYLSIQAFQYLVWPCLLSYSPLSRIGLSQLSCGKRMPLFWQPLFASSVSVSFAWLISSRSTDLDYLTN